MKFEIIEGNILQANVDAIVNAANNQLSQGGGICGAIFKEADSENLQKECNVYKYCETGKAVITSGYNLKARHIIHAVGPVYFESKNPSEELKNTYLSSLKLADKNNLKSIAFPCISTGYFGYPLKEASKIALETVINYKPTNLEICYLYCYTIDEYLIFNTLLKEYRCTK